MKHILETKQLYLRPFTIDDATHLYELNNDLDVLKYTSDLPFKNIESAQQFIAHYITNVYTNPATGIATKMGRYAVIRKQDRQFIGWCGLKYHKDKRYTDVGYRLYKKYWNLGYATESATSIINYAFNTIQLPFLVAHVHTKNIASQRVLDKIGMHKHLDIIYDNAPSLLYKIKNKDYQLKTITSQETWPVRHPVLRKGRPLEDVYMEADNMPTTFHLGMYHKEHIVGVASFMEDSFKDFTGKQFRLRGMAVLPEYRKKGLAELLLKKGEQLLKEKQCTLLWFNAREVAVNFYKSIGYEIVSGIFDIPKVGPHYRMKKQL